VKFFDTSLNKLVFIQFLFDLDQILPLWFPIQILTPIILVLAQFQVSLLIIILKLYALLLWWQQMY